MNAHTTSLKYLWKKSILCNNSFKTIRLVKYPYTKHNSSVLTRLIKQRNIPCCPKLWLLDLPESQMRKKYLDKIGLRILNYSTNTHRDLQQVIYHGKISENWRRANVVAVFKKGRKSEASNYRPISLTCVCCKILEHIIASSIMRHTQDHNIIYDLQHGFRNQCSCEKQLLGFQVDIMHTIV